MGEEAGSPGLDELFVGEKEAFSADVLIASDGPRLDPGRPMVFTGSRSVVRVDLDTRFRDGAYHSGNWGGVLKDPMIRLAHALSAIVGPHGESGCRNGDSSRSLSPSVMHLSK